MRLACGFDVIIYNFDKNKKLVTRANGSKLLVLLKT